MRLLYHVFCDIQNNQYEGKSYQLKVKAEADNTYQDLVVIFQPEFLWNYAIIIPYNHCSS